MNSNYSEISEKIKKKKYHDEKYFLISKKYITQIKNDYNYEEINQLLDKYKSKNQYNEYDNNKNKILLSIIKEIPINKLEYYFEKKELNKKYQIDILEPDFFLLKLINTVKLLFIMI